MNSFYVGFEKKAISPTAAGFIAGSIPAAQAMYKIQEVNKKEKEVPKTKSVDTFLKSINPGDILYGGFRARSGDTLTKLILEEPRNALFALGGQADSHSMLYLGDGKAFHIGKPHGKRNIETEVPRNTVNLENFLKQKDQKDYNFIAYRPKGACPKEQAKAVKEVKTLTGSKYTSNTGLLLRGLASIIGVSQDSEKIKPKGKDLICTDVPAKAYSKVIPNRNLSILEMKALPVMEPVAKIGDRKGSLIEQLSASFGNPAVKGVAVGIPVALAAKGLQ
jgi:hypothetical protein